MLMRQDAPPDAPSAAVNPPAVVRLPVSRQGRNVRFRCNFDLAFDQPSNCVANVFSLLRCGFEIFAGCINKAAGNVYIQFLGDKLLASHLALLYQEGRLPSRLVYLDGDRTNIKYLNLEEHATKKLMYCKPWGNVPFPSRYRGLVKGIAEGCYRHKSQVSIDSQGLTQWVA